MPSIIIFFSIIIFLISSEKCVNLFSLLLYICQHNIYIILPCNLVVPHCPHTKKTFTNLCCKRNIVRNHLFFFFKQKILYPFDLSPWDLFFKSASSPYHLCLYPVITSLPMSGLAHSLMEQRDGCP